ncbi:MAG TPA: hypothetical protein VD866_31765 [Urbifossiella sp.]|nr:hypothetical protein [Urbifossiella sp.]
MHRFRAWGLAAVAAAGGTAAAAADPPPRAARPPQTTVVDKLFGKSRPKAEPAPAAKADVPTGLPPDVKAAALRDEQDAYERRMAVCLKLREVAQQREDENLHRQVDDLERQAGALYLARAAALGLPKTRPADVLDRQLGTGVAVTPLTAPAPPTPAGPATAAARATAPTGDRDVREVRP